VDKSHDDSVVKDPDDPSCYTETDESAYSDLEVIENKNRSLDTITIKGVVVPKEIAKLLANMHSLLVNKMLQRKS